MIAYFYQGLQSELHYPVIHAPHMQSPTIPFSPSSFPSKQFNCHTVYYLLPTQKGVLKNRGDLREENQNPLI